MDNLLSKESIGKRLKQLRKNYGLSQTVFADRIGLNRGNYAQIEMGKQYPTYDVLIKVSKEFDKSYDWILHGFDAEEVVEELIGLESNKSSSDISNPYTFLPSFKMERCVVIRKEQFNAYLQQSENIDFLGGLSVVSWPESLGENAGKRAFEVIDHQLSPFLQPSDLAICRSIGNLGELVEQRIYVVMYNNNISFVKFQFISEDNELIGAIDSLYLRTIKVPLTSITQIWEVVGKLSHNIYGVEQNTDVSLIRRELLNLRFELDKIKRKGQ